MDELLPYINHIGNCGAVGEKPNDERCICGLRQIWTKLAGNYKAMMHMLPVAYKEGGK